MKDKEYNKEVAKQITRLWIIVTLHGVILLLMAIGLLVIKNGM